jgi:hypothetical protein
MWIEKLLNSNHRVTPKIRTEKYVIIPQEDNVESVFKRCHKYVLDTSTKIFQYKFLNDILANNYWLRKWKIVEDETCTFCKNNVENMYSGTPVTRPTWDRCRMVMLPGRSRSWKSGDEFPAKKLYRSIAYLHAWLRWCTKPFSWQKQLLLGKRWLWYKYHDTL